MSLNCDGSDVLHPDLDAWDLLRGAARDAGLKAIDREIGRLSAVRAAMITRTERCQAYADDGYQTPQQWVRATGNMSYPSSRYQVQMARMLAKLPKVAEALSTGSIGPDQIRVFVDLWANPRCREHLPGFESFLLGCAVRFVLHEFKEVAARFKLGADPDGAHRDHEQSVKQRHAQYDTVGAWFRLILEGDAVSGEMMKRVLDAHMEAAYLTGGRCTGPGCHTRHNGIQIDHIRSWELFGHTDQDNAEPMCGRCNREKHARKFSVKRDENGWHFYRPDGGVVSCMSFELYRAESRKWTRRSTVCVRSTRPLC